MDYLGRHSQRKVVGSAAFPNALRIKISLSYVVALPKNYNELVARGTRRCHDQNPRTIIPGTSPRCRYFRASFGTSDRKFVFAWLVGIAFVATAFVALVLIIPFLSFKH
jgi:hypothetical protein